VAGEWNEVVKERMKERKNEMKLVKKERMKEKKLLNEESVTLKRDWEKERKKWSW
jgi:hypothetical protein